MDNDIIDIEDYDVVNKKEIDENNANSECSCENSNDGNYGENNYNDSYYSKTTVGINGIASIILSILLVILVIIFVMVFM